MAIRIKEDKNLKKERKTKDRLAEFLNVRRVQLGVAQNIKGSKAEVTALIYPTDAEPLGPSNKNTPEQTKRDEASQSGSKAGLLPVPEIHAEQISLVDLSLEEDTFRLLGP